MVEDDILSEESLQKIKIHLRWCHSLPGLQDIFWIRAQKGRFDVQQNIVTHLPSTKPTWNQITIRRFNRVLTSDCFKANPHWWWRLLPLLSFLKTPVVSLVKWNWWYTTCEWFRLLVFSVLPPLSRQGDAFSGQDTTRAICATISEQTWPAFMSV